MAVMHECMSSVANLMSEIERTDLESDVDTIERIGRMVEEHYVITIFLVE